ncbi:DUF6221 family protein [Streptomyces sp. NBC_01485]|uniref:DUF6221 family protein n=1 Tax=Streptomyces sp. NBC_01485 TaxID=2903884 RepID=UPI002E36D899|nr:DUF6221 family protein [Streptomyces sp. NBC_01485]
MDLHAWITQQVDRVEETARAVEDRSAPWDGLWMADGNRAVRTVNGHVLFYRHKSSPLKPGLADHVALNDPAAVLRRCEADRRILARHRLDPGAAGTDRAAACDGCGVEWVQDCCDPVTDNLNDCPELLDLAHAHGLTDEILTSLDRPQPPESKPSIRSRYANGGILTTPITTSDIPAALRGPHWKP